MCQTQHIVVLLIKTPLRSDIGNFILQNINKQTKKKHFATISSQQKQSPDDITENNIPLNCY